MPPAPTFSAAGVLNAATGKTGLIAPGEMLVISGSAIGPAQRIDALVNSYGRLNRTLSGTRVLFDEVPGTILYTSSGSVGVTVPYYSCWKDTTNVQVEYNGGVAPRRLDHPIAK